MTSTAAPRSTEQVSVSQLHIFMPCPGQLPMAPRTNGCRDASTGPGAFGTGLLILFADNTEPLRPQSRTERFGEIHRS